LRDRLDKGWRTGRAADLDMLRATGVVVFVAPEEARGG
jgi:hypothetical protein